MKTLEQFLTEITFHPGIIEKTASPEAKKAFWQVLSIRSKGYGSPTKDGEKEIAELIKSLSKSDAMIVVDQLAVNRELAPRVIKDLSQIVKEMK